MSITADITDLRRGTVTATRYLHATGGLRGSWTTDGWFFGPLHHQRSFRSIGPVSDQAVGAACKAMSACVFGADEVSEPGTLLPSRVGTFCRSCLWRSAARRCLGLGCPCCARG